MSSPTSSSPSVSHSLPQATLCPRSHSRPHRSRRLRLVVAWLLASGPLVTASALAAETLLVKNGLFLTQKPGAEAAFVGYMTVGADGRITAVAPGEVPPATEAAAAQVLDAAGSFVAPGFVSAHSHLANAQFRGLGHTQTLYGWSQATSRLNRHTAPDDVYWFSLFATHEFLRNGITTVFDLTRARPADATGDAAAAYDFDPVRAKIDGGIRFVNAVPLAPSGTPEEQSARLAALLARAKTAYGENPRYLKMALSGAGHRGSSLETVKLEVELMRRFDLMNQSHYLESPEGVPEQQAKFAWYVEAGALGPDLIFGHFIHTTPEMVAMAAKTGAAMSWQPLSNGRLGSGVIDFAAYRAAGLRMGMGLDSHACTDTCDPFVNMQTGLSLVRATAKDSAVLSVHELLRLHTLGAAEVMRVADQIGSLEPGKFADFVIVDPGDPYTGPIHDPVAHYVLACGLRNLKQVYVGGRLVAEGTRLVGQDEKQVRTEIETRVARIRAQADIADRRFPAPARP